MKNLIENEVLFVKIDYSIDKVIRLMSNSSRKVKFPGVAIVIDKNNNKVTNITYINAKEIFIPVL